MAFTVFKNDKKLPLNELTLQLEEGGSKRSLPALHEKWSEPRVFTRYVPFPFKAGAVEEGPALEQWIAETGWFIKDLRWLLGLEHFRFWSTMVHNRGAIETVISFTQTAIPYYLAGVVRGAATVYPLYSEAHRLTIQVICRLVTQRESDQCWLAKEFLGDLLYRHYLVSVPLLVELLPVYGCADNKPLLTRLLQTVFKLQPKYVQDLSVAVKFLQETFKTIQRQIESDRIEGQVANAATLNDLAVYTLDCCTTLALLVELYPDCRPVCADLGLEQSISGFYDNTLVLLYKNVFTMDNESPYLTYLNAARRDLLAAFRAIVQLQLEKAREGGPNSLNPADKFLCILTECLSEPIFVRDYQRHYPLDEDLHELKQTVSGLDHFKLDFVASAYCGGEENGKLTNGHASSDSDAEEEDVVVPKEPAARSDVELTPEQKVEADVRKVLDVLPHLGDGYVRKILKRYGDDPEQAIAAILEGNLPPDLAEADPAEPYIPPDVKDRFFVETGIERLNIYDGDELDVLTRDTVRGVIKRGKGMPGQPRNMREMLDDKSHVREMKTRTRYQEYQIVCDEYDDEYDDSFDAMADSESKKIRLTKEMRNALVDEEEEDEEGGGEEEGEFQPSKKPLDFCENPEVARARYEERRRSKQQARGGGAGGPSGSGGGGQQAPERDVVGKAKGQGQDKAVLQNRKHKNENKAAKGNHNRKAGATFKRNKGMIPS
ncbi:activating signal cointegrator 1 complex subunit 2 [Culex pipiens pallens]|uniref:activating signal cointegrator 1 complex subunit 2 n=1 Tax=Culex pipiens pallens TaxID=42434 RepID=UPI0022AB0E80|nr:activating signal cointegrator 1 complex subunit 2 [Culex pipiens pallens]